MNRPIIANTEHGGGLIEAAARPRTMTTQGEQAKKEPCVWRHPETCRFCDAENCQDGTR